MAIINTNPVQRIDDDTILNSTWIRIINYSGEDRSEAPSSTNIQFAFYASKEKWDSGWITNIIRVNGIGHDNTLTLPYSREDNGVDIPMYWYSKLIEHLLTIFPDWSIENFELDIYEPSTGDLPIEY